MTTPSREDAVLDIVLINKQKYYDKPKIFFITCLSDHNNVVVQPMIRENTTNTRKFLLKEHKRASPKAEMGRYLTAIAWHRLFGEIVNCEDLASASKEL